MGLMSGRKLKKDRKKFRDNKLPDKKRRLGISLKFDPIGRASQAKGIVVKKIQKEAKQPNSAMRKGFLNCTKSWAWSSTRAAASYCFGVGSQPSWI